MSSRRSTLSSVVAWVLLCLGPVTCLAQARSAVPVREADAACGRCHATILETYLKTTMANASGPAEDRLLPGVFHQASSGVTYTVSNEDQHPELRYTLPGSPPVSGRERLRYFLGSGHLGLTYLYERNGYWLESPVAYYPDLHAYAMKPGLENSQGMPVALTLNPTCLRCHMSGVQKQVTGSKNLYVGLPFEQTGITCEGCHGDTREHVRSGGRAAVINPIKLSPAKRDSTCIVCHLEGDSHVTRRDRDPLDFRPGDDIRDFLTYFVHDRADSTRRAVSEIEQFSESRCKRATGAAMSCMNCHDPHSSPSPAERVAFYRGRCLTCHTAKAIATEHFPATPDCTGCHMPKTGAENVAHVAWTDHRILRTPVASPLQLSATSLDSPADHQLVPILEGTPGHRDLGLAYYDLAVRGDAPARQTAVRLLSDEAAHDPSDPQVLRSLGILAQLGNSARQAQGDYQAALKLDPSDFVAGTNLGTLLAASGNLEEAAALWNRIFAINQDIPELGRNLATVECRLGHKEAAQQALRTVLLYSPGLQAVRDLASDIASGRQTCDPPRPLAGASPGHAPIAP